MRQKKTPTSTFALRIDSPHVSVLQASLVTSESSSSATHSCKPSLLESTSWTSTTHRSNTTTYQELTGFQTPRSTPSSTSMTALFLYAASPILISLLKLVAKAPMYWLPIKAMKMAIWSNAGNLDISRSGVSVAQSTVYLYFKFLIWWTVNPLAMNEAASDEAGSALPALHSCSWKRRYCCFYWRERAL